MELVQGTHKASKFAPEDILSNMPDNVITHILDRLPLQYAVRTGILSRNWRFKWNMLSQLVFDEDFFEYVTERKNDENYERIISRLLLQFKGAITKCVLYLQEECYDIAQWIEFLSRKGVKELTILKRDYEVFKLPTQLYSCLELKHLLLETCFFDPPASFHGFPNLLSLELSDVDFERGKFVEFFTQCPILEILIIDVSYPGSVKLADIAKLTNLKMLTLFLCNIDDITSSSGIFELVGFLPKLQELHLDFEGCKSFIEDDARKRSPTTFPRLNTLKLSKMDLGSGSSGIILSFAFEIIRSSPNLQTLEIKSGEWSCNEDGARKRPPTTFPSLKTLKLLFIDFGSDIVLSFAFEIIRSSPNLQTLEITSSYRGVESSRAICCPEIDYNAIRMLQLRSVIFRGLKGTKSELRWIKYLLACSPSLKKFVICLQLLLVSDEKLVFVRKLLKLHRASPIVHIDLY